MLIAIYHVLKYGVPFRDLGADYYNGFNREHKIRGYLKRLKAHGLDSDIPPCIRLIYCPLDFARRKTAVSLCPGAEVVFIAKTARFVHSGRLCLRSIPPTLASGDSFFLKGRIHTLRFTTCYS